jgi:hypothetical protein
MARVGGLGDNARNVRFHPFRDLRGCPAVTCGKVCTMIFHGTSAHHTKGSCDTGGPLAGTRRLMFVWRRATRNLQVRGDQRYSRKGGR